MRTFGSSPVCPQRGLQRRTKEEKTYFLFVSKDDLLCLYFYGLQFRQKTARERMQKIRAILVQKFAFNYDECRLPSSLPSSISSGEKNHYNSAKWPFFRIARGCFSPLQPSLKHELGKTVAFFITYIHSFFSIQLCSSSISRGLLLFSATFLRS